MCVDGRSLSKALSFKPSASLRGACELRHYITRGVMSRPNLLQWTIPLPEFMFCPEEEAGETKQACGEVYKCFWGRIYYKKASKKIFWGHGRLFSGLEICLSWFFLWGRTLTPSYFVWRWKQVSKSHEGQRERQIVFPSIRKTFKCDDISKTRFITKDTADIFLCLKKNLKNTF